MSDAQEAKKPAVTKILVTNVTQRNGSAGHFLDPGEAFGNKLLGPGRSMYFDCVNGHLPDIIERWGDAVTVHDAASGDALSGPVAHEISRGVVSPVREMTGTQDGVEDDFMDGEELNLDDAVQAVIPSRLTDERTAPIAGSLRQQQAPRARVSLGSRNEEVIGGEISPIPGDRPRNLDDTERFTVKAPRSHAVGAVIGKK